MNSNFSTTKKKKIIIIIIKKLEKEMRGKTKQPQGNQKVVRKKTSSPIMERQLMTSKIKN
jgi:hypothetical protein